MDSVLDFAKKYAELGYQVHPLKFRDKSPASPHGFKDASSDPKSINNFFNKSEINIGIATGLKSKIAVIDIDPKNGGLESFEILKTKFNLPIETLTVVTGGGGRHLYYECTEPTKSRNGVLPGIDIKADLGYIVAPPSVHPNGVPYTFSEPFNFDKISLLPFPSEIISGVDKSKKKKRKKKPDSGEKILEGERHNFIVSKYGKISNLGLSLQELEAKLYEINQKRCIPPLPNDEIVAIINSFQGRTIEKILLYASQTDFGNAERFKAFCGDDLIFVEKMLKWHHYENGRYEEDSAGSRAIQKTKKMIRRAREIGSEIFGDNGDSLDKFLKNSESHAKVTAMLKLAQTEMPVDPVDLDRDPFHFNVKNGTIDLRSGILMPHNKRNLISKISSIEFDEKKDCPIFKKFLDDVTGGSKELQEYLQRVVGYCLTGVITEQCFWILYGLGSNGKTTFVEIIKKIFGEYGRAADISTFTYKQSEQIRNDLARLHDARFVASVEIQEGKLLDESVIKQVTGGDPVTCRFLFKEHFEYIPKWKLFMVVNHLPIITGTDHGIWRRIKCVPFNVQFNDDRKDKNLFSKLESENPGILNWAVEGCLKWQKTGLQEPELIVNSGKEYRANEDIIEEFLNSFTTRGDNFHAGATALFMAYKDHQDRIGQRVMSQKLFSQKLKIKGFDRDRGGNGGRYRYIGLKLKGNEYSLHE